MNWKNHLDKIGVAGSFIAAACCLGLPAILAILTAIGLGFIVHDAVLVPLLVVFLAVTLLGLWFGYRVHKRRTSLLLASVSAVFIVFFILIWTVPAAVYFGIAGLIAATLLNVLHRRRCGAVCEA
ncbi:MAG: MerC domain-containing protein [Bryobacteraceae bacterium]|nr:MerC domain-containing protein [Bryobacteraceae bacterium]